MPLAWLWCMLCECWWLPESTILSNYHPSHNHTLCKSILKTTTFHSQHPKWILHSIVCHGSGGCVCFSADLSSTDIIPGLLFTTEWRLCQKQITTASKPSGVYTPEVVIEARKALRAAAITALWFGLTP